MSTSRKERLTTELREAELLLDGAGRVGDPGMRKQQKLAGLRCRVLGLRVELLQIEIDGLIGKNADVLARRAALCNDRASLLTHMKAGELSERAASKQATEDDVPALLARMDDLTEAGAAFDNLH